MQPKDLSVTAILPSAAGAADVRTAAASTPVIEAREAVMKDTRRRMVIPVEKRLRLKTLGAFTLKVVLSKFRFGSESVSTPGRHRMSLRPRTSPTSADALD